MVQRYAADTLKVRFAAAGPEAFAREGGEGEYEIRQHGGVEREYVEVEVKGLAGLNGESVEVAGAEDEGTG
jgi:hypothetical protein